MKFILVVLFSLIALPGWARSPSANPPELPEPTEIPKPTTFEVRVHLAHGTTSEKIGDTVVFLRAARPKGPFEPTDPTPEFEWTEMTDEEGLATFQVPRTLTTTGLRLHAVATYGGVTFRSAAEPPVDALQLKVPVYELGNDPKALSFDNIRTVVELWEDYLVFTQFYTLVNNSQTVIDTTTMPGFDPERGMPIELPIKALGVQVSAGGESSTVKSIAYWKGRIRPSERVPIQIRFSMAAHDPSFVYEQVVQYATKNTEVVVPLQTQFQKVPRLNDVTLSVPGGKMLSGLGILGLREDMEFVGSEGVALQPGESIRFKVDNLPLRRPMMPFVILGLGLLFGGVVIFLGRREQEMNRQTHSRKIAIESLNREKEDVLAKIAALQQSMDDFSEAEYESNDLALRARLALILKKIEDLEASVAGAA